MRCVLCGSAAGMMSPREMRSVVLLEHDCSFSLTMSGFHSFVQQWSWRAAVVQAGLKALWAGLEPHLPLLLRRGTMRGPWVNPVAWSQRVQLLLGPWVPGKWEGLLAIINVCGREGRGCSSG